MKTDLNISGKQSLLKLLLLISLSLIALIFIVYFTSRNEFVQLITLYLILFILYIFIYYNKTARNAIELSFALAVILRLTLLLAEPNLSDDFYRFIWDGKMAADGHNPFLIMPHSFYHPGSSETSPFLEHLYKNMNSPHYYTIYPPVLQFIFETAYQIAGNNITGNIIIMRLFIIAGEIASMALILSLLKKLNLPRYSFIIYAFNPLIIIELTGNLHFEALMITFLLTTLWLYIKHKWIFSAFSLGIATSVKLLPLITLPFFIRRLSFKKLLIFGTTVFVTFFACFAFYFSIPLLNNIYSSIELYFQKFEFNASIYYILRWIGFEWQGYNMIRKIGILMAIFIFLSILFLAITEKNKTNYNLIRLMLYAFTIFFLFSTTVHPWYISTLVMFSVFLPYTFPIAWSGTAMLSYVAYIHDPVKENLYLLTIEYLVVFSFLFYDIFKNNYKKRLPFY